MGILDPGVQKIAKKVNSMLFAVNFVIVFYIILAPAGPELSFFVRHSILKIQTVPQNYSANNSTALAEQQDPAQPKKIVPQDNRLEIPQLDIDGVIHEGDTISELQKGIWRRPQTSTPDANSNTVLVAHRFLYTSGPNTFYHLDKVKTGDVLTVYWKGNQYDYQVFNVETVAPTRTDIENPTMEPILTLYTCTPLFSSSKRLVVQAKLISVQ